MSDAVPSALDLRADPDADLAPVVEHLRAGGVVAYPTETVYGLGSACTEEGVRRVQALKRRDADKPLIVLVPSAESVSSLRWTDAARELAATFWPGAISIVAELNVFSLYTRKMKKKPTATSAFPTRTP